jgi:hypothetical protein
MWQICATQYGVTSQETVFSIVSVDHYCSLSGNGKSLSVVSEVLTSIGMTSSAISQQCDLAEGYRRFNYEVRGRTLLRNISKNLPHYMVSHPR